MKLRICAHCERVFLDTKGPGCPKCEFASYEATWALDSRWRAFWTWLFQWPWHEHVSHCRLCKKEPIL